MCGENKPRHAIPKYNKGSPPHVRGKHLVFAKITRNVGITPACAGKTLRHLSFVCASWDHPRMCGENNLIWYLLLAIRGSPPHVRGKQEKIIVERVQVGITPACAGKTFPPCTSEHASWDHPRMCGENLMLISIAKGKDGSPPHVRGKPSISTGFLRYFRITPACAGKTTGQNYGGFDNKDHPRMCGENAWYGSLCVMMSGSPPHVRGKRCR